MLFLGMKRFISTFFVLTLSNTLFATDAIVVTKRARTLHDSSLIVDGHADTTQFFLDPSYDLGAHHPDGHFHLDFDKAKAGNLGAQFFSIWVDPGSLETGYAHQALTQIDAVYSQVRKNPKSLELVTTADGILKAHKAQKLAALMGIEGGHVIENDLALLRNFYRLGVRYMTLTWSNSTDWAESSGSEIVAGVKAPKGLTDFGKDVVLEMNRLGMLVDISHVSDNTFWDVIKTTQAPIIASHSSARALTDHPRNMTDDMLRAVAKNGGIIMVNYFSGFISQAFLGGLRPLRKEIDEAQSKIHEAYKGKNPGLEALASSRARHEIAAKVKRPPLSALIDHIDHLVKFAGIDHVGLGSDFDGISSLPEGIDSAADLPKITQALLDRGYLPQDIRKILGLNLIRVMRECERISRSVSISSER